MASARKAALHKRLDVVRDKVALELEQVPVDVYKIDVYKELIHNLTEELKTLNSTRDTLIDMPTEQEVTVKTEDGGEYPTILFGGRLDIDALKDQLAQDGLMLTKLDGKTPYRDGNGLSRTVFTASIINAQTTRNPETKRSWKDNQWGKVIIGFKNGAVILVSILCTIGVIVGIPAFIVIWHYASKS